MVNEKNRATKPVAVAPPDVAPKGLAHARSTQRLARVRASDGDKYLALARTLFHAEDFAGAQGAASVAAACDPKRFEAWVLMAIALRKQESWERAAEAFLQALALAPDSLECWTDLGETYLEIPNYAAAAAALHQAVVLDPDSAHPSGRRARALVGRTITLLNKI